MTTLRKCDQPTCVRITRAEFQSAVILEFGRRLLLLVLSVDRVRCGQTEVSQEELNKQKQVH